MNGIARKPSANVCFVYKSCGQSISVVPLIRRSTEQDQARFASEVVDREFRTADPPWQCSVDRTGLRTASVNRRFYWRHQRSDQRRREMGRQPLASPTKAA